jgi:hypothetical protein
MLSGLLPHNFQKSPTYCSTCQAFFGQEKLFNSVNIYENSVLRSFTYQTKFSAKTSVNNEVKGYKYPYMNSILNYDK